MIGSNVVFADMIAFDSAHPLAGILMLVYSRFTGASFVLERMYCLDGLCTECGVSAPQPTTPANYLNVLIPSLVPILTRILTTRAALWRACVDAAGLPSCPTANHPTCPHWTVRTGTLWFIMDTSTQTLYLLRCSVQCSPTAVRCPRLTGR